jgi:ATP-dependent exoDNAse (exonuclease V) beta subunit
MTRHPGAKFYPEYTVVSKDVSGDLRKMMGDNDLVGGTIDLLVREENGDTYIYDFKTSSHPMIVGNKTNES